MTTETLTLQEDIETRRRQIKADGYGMSIGEVKNLYLADELEIHPSFQRFFRWTPQQKSNLIESFLLGIPVPPIFVSTREDGVWDVVDGVQRLSTVLQFMGVLKTAEGELVKAEPLVAAEYLTTLAGVVYDENAAKLAGVSTEQALSDVLRRDFARGKIEFRIIQKSSDPQAKFDLFQRLNSGTRLTEQESRNSLAVMLDPKLYDWLNQLSSETNFLDTVLISERKIVSQYATELVVRFLAGVIQPPAALVKMKDVSSFLDDTVRILATQTEEQRGALGDQFRQTFDLLNKTVSEGSFRRWTGDRYKGGFNLGAFEAIAVGLAHNIAAWSGAPLQTVEAELRTITQNLWTDEVFTERSGSGRPGTYRMPALVARGAELFAR